LLPNRTLVTDCKQVLIKFINKLLEEHNIFNLFPIIILEHYNIVTPSSTNSFKMIITSKILILTI
jgi:predicted methyltransferase